jgi:glycosyltransferase involved in cell wall biosynthesis
VNERAGILVLNQYYWPGVEATAHLFTELCEALARDFDVKVVTGRVRDRPDLATREVRNGVEIVRVASSAFDRSQLSRRALNYVTYLGRAFAAGAAGRRPDVVLCGTDPPIIGDLGLLVARRHSAALVVVSEDVFPEIAVALDRLQSKPLIWLLSRLVRTYLVRADRVVAIGETMRRRLEKKGARPERVQVIPNWTDVNAITPREKENKWARGQGFDSKFVVMHSGNTGHAQDLDSLIRAATFLPDLDDLRIVVIGTGARHAELTALAERLGTANVEFLEFQPRELLPDTLASADVHVVGLARGLAGYVVPSRLYGVLAAGRPVIAAAEDESETAKLVREVGCGVVVPPGDPLALATVIRACRDGEYDLADMGRRAREYAEVNADRTLATERYRGLITGVLAS